MNHFHTSVLERRRRFVENFETHPYEAGWAREAIFFIHVEEVEGKGAVLKAGAQISPDGIHWLDEGRVFEPIEKEGRYFLKVDSFGGWLRLSGAIGGEDAAFKATVQLALKS